MRVLSDEVSLMPLSALLLLALLLPACSAPPARSDPTPDPPSDTLAFEALGDFHLGMDAEQVESVAEARGERLQCRLLKGRFHCTPAPTAPGEERYAVMFQGDTAVLLGWRLPITLDSLQRRYASLGTLVASGLATDTTDATLSLWVNADSTAERMAICHTLDEPTCSITLTRSDPAELPRRVEGLRATFERRARQRAPS